MNHSAKVWKYIENIGKKRYDLGKICIQL